MTVKKTDIKEDFFLAYQPVLNRDQKVWGYEIFFRDDESSDSFFLRHRDEAEVTRDVLLNICFCPDQKFGSARMIINFTEDAIFAGYANALHPDNVIIQLKDREDFSPELSGELVRLAEGGYAFSIDEFRNLPCNRKIYRLAELLTVHINDLGIADAGNLLEEASRFDAVCLAKGVGDQKRFADISNLGFDLFQGIFFQKPKIQKIRRIPSGQLVRFEILELLCSDSLDFDSISDIISKDATLSVRLLQLLNSPAYGLVQKITSLKQATVYLGLEHLKQWLKVIILSDMKQPGTTKELLRVSLLRAKFLKNIGSRLQTHEEANRLFLLGLFSLLDSLYQVPMDRIMICLSVLDEEIRNTLTGTDTRLSRWLDLAVSMENSDWSKVGAALAILGMDSGLLMPCYLDALKWANLAIKASSTT